MSYDHKNIDAKWQERWEREGIFHAKDGDSREKYYVLVEFPYPSAAGLHVGHPRSYTALDIVARKKRMEGKNVLYPIGWDAFGLPAENYAIKTGVHPSIVTKQNIDNFRRQLKSIGFSFDWSREVDTTDPAYYKWTQWMFLEFFKAGLAYKKRMAINWCPKDKIGLANEEVIGGACERCGTPVEKRDKEQWMIAITKYADRLLADLDTVNYLPKIRKQQEEWIGRSEGAEIGFAIDETSEKITVFTTRPDTIFGVTYVVLAPEHPLVASITTPDQRLAVDAYIADAKKKTDIERGDDTKEKTGVFTGAYAINPANNEKIPVWVADYVLAHYGTGAVMAVPAHDERDFLFAKKFALPIVEVIAKQLGDRLPDFHKRESARGIIVKDGKVLLTYDKKMKEYILPGGGVEAGEDPSKTILREIKEEIGYVHTRIVRSLGTIEHNYFHTYHKNHWSSMVAGFVVELMDDEVQERTQEEIAKTDFVWLSLEEAKQELKNHADTFSKEVEFIERYEKGQSLCFEGQGVAFNSDFLDGSGSVEAKIKVVDWLESEGRGRRTVNYKLRDWVFSRQRYWGEPIPLVHCEKDGWVPVPVEQLPVVLPSVEKYEPTDNGESLLANIESFVNTTCPTCGGPAKRETDTMPNWAGSSWYFLRYLDPKNDQAFASKEALKYWMPVDLYNGGMEHTTLHLLYSRFWNKFLFDQGHVPTSEPYTRRHSHGLIMSDDGTKMSKSKGNVVNPDDVVQEHGADTLRVYEVFMGPFEEPVPWSTNGVIGVRRFLDKVMRLSEKVVDVEDVLVTKSLHKTIVKVTKDIESFGFNTAVAQLMTFANTVQERGSITKQSFETFLRLLVPFAPHVANELWEKLGCEGFVEVQEWPVADASMLKDDEIEIAVQVNGKVRASILVPADATDDEIVAKARVQENVMKYFEGEPKKVIVVKGRLVSFVV